MRWGFEIPGQPPSVNNMYTQIILRRGVSSPVRSVKKDDAVAAYQVGATYIARTSKPRGWAYGGGQLRIYYDFKLKRMADADNMLKALNDAIAKALNVDDKVFLPCVRSKTTGHKDPSVLVEIDDGAP